MTAVRLAKLEKQLNDDQRQELKTVAGGKSIQQITRDLLNALDVDQQFPQAQQQFNTLSPNEGNNQNQEKDQISAPITRTISITIRIMPNLYIIGGANGSGKTTAALQILPYFLEVFEYVNADEIAAGLSPFKPESVASQAGRLMLERLETLVNAEADFAFETTLAARNFARFLRKCKNKGYIINLIYFWLQSPELAIARVRRRVESGGHNIPEDTIRRRYERERKNLIELYLPLCDRWIVYDNSNPILQIIAERPFNQEPIIYQPQLWNQITTNTYE